MAVTSLAVVVPAIIIFTLGFTGLSGYFVYRQNTTLYREVKVLLLYVHVFFGGVLILEFLRNFLSSTLFITIYTIGGTSFILWDVLLLMTVGAAVYLKPEGEGIRKLVATIVRRRITGSIYFTIAIFILAVNAYLVVFQPFVPIGVTNIVGIQVESTSFGQTYLTLVLVVLILFLIYPTALFLNARSKTKDRQVRRALLLLPIVWSAIGLDLVVFNGFLLSRGIDDVAVGYLFASIAFAITATIFRRASLLSGFFGPVTAIQIDAPTFAFSESLNIPSTSLVGRTFLFELDPSYNYEQVVNDFAVELLSNKKVVFVFTSKRSPVYNSLSKVKGVRFYILSSSVSYPRAADVPDEILVPLNDQAILLDIIQKTISADPDAKIGLVYDNVSDLILSSSVESAYKFLKQANEIIDLDRVVSIFLFTSNAHDERTSNLVRTLFTNQILMTHSGPKIVRQ
ncbi:MAG: hypothetical protein JRN20_01430 [Nitrososphaerota archaeon]|jgi:hypothetical protein|nr:hypothetical protein [Nitrososphaerota archaeon]MDG6922025.1 hypothetical protein [Nitrososphaerota archaeon]